MARYVIRATKPLYVETPLWDDQCSSHTPHVDVDGPAEIDTGLITEDGYPIMRLQVPIGFGRDEEW